MVCTSIMQPTRTSNYCTPISFARHGANRLRCASHFGATPTCTPTRTSALSIAPGYTQRSSSSHRHSLVGATPSQQAPPPSTWTALSTLQLRYNYVDMVQAAGCPNLLFLNTPWVLARSMFDNWLARAERPSTHQCSQFLARCTDVFTPPAVTGRPGPFPNDLPAHGRRSLYMIPELSHPILPLFDKVKELFGRPDIFAIGNVPSPTCVTAPTATLLKFLTDTSATIPAPTSTFSDTGPANIILNVRAQRNSGMSG
jgi:hypothetical protein